jgi:hypothetical protein
LATLANEVWASEKLFVYNLKIFGIFRAADYLLRYKAVNGQSYLIKNFSVLEFKGQNKPPCPKLSPEMFQLAMML